jgi:hypothetical protein
MQTEFNLQKYKSGFLNRARHMAGAAAVSVLLAVSLTPPADALEMTSLYSVEVPFDAEDPDRKNAYRTALDQVLIRITGTTAAAESPELAELFPNPARYVSQYRSGPDNSVIVSLDGPAIEKVLRQSGAMVWGSERPLTLVWLAVDWGQGEREIVAADDARSLPGAGRSIDRNRLLRERVDEVASLRGIPVVFPLLDTQDLESINFSDIWGGFDDRVLDASLRYGATSVLVGRIKADEVQGLGNRWTWYLDNERLDWGGEPEEVVNLMADSLALQYAFRGNEPLDAIRLSISGINSVVAYGEVQRLVENLAAIDTHLVESVEGDKITYEVQVQGGAERLQRALEQSRLLEPIAATERGIDSRFDQSSEDLYEFDDRSSVAPMSLEFLYRAN